ncbi:MAG TPA: M48 family metalloprotease [Usitatibacter sp.]
MNCSRAFGAIALSMALCASMAFAQPAASPRAPAAGTEDEAFRNEAAAQYRKILAGLSARGQLDDDEVTLERVRRISAGLIAAAAQARPETGAWSWEVHVTSDRSKGAFCMAGGKVLVGSALVKRLDLGDGELAMLLGHEIAHAVAGHRREAIRSSMDADVAQEIRQAEIAVMQEDEADRIGMGLAYRAGWPATSLVSFYDKLAAQEGPGTFNSSHPSAQSRAAMARAMAQQLGKQPR